MKSVLIENAKNRSLMIAKILDADNGAHLHLRMGETGVQSLNNRRIGFMAFTFQQYGINNTIIA
jgi:hypothetical protein